MHTVDVVNRSQWESALNARLVEEAASLVLDDPITRIGIVSFSGMEVPSQC